MKIIGNKDLFAIEYILDSVRPNNYFGNIWFWINNKKIGTEDADTYLSSCVRYLKDFLELKPLRRYYHSEKMKPEELFYKICGIFGIGKGTKENHYLNFHIYRDIFWLESIGDANFRDNVEIVLIDESDMNRQRFLWKKYQDEKLEEFFISYGYFEIIANEFIRQIEKEVEEWSK